jgi:hypothetical protein
MVGDYLHWQFVVGPAWLVRLFLNIQHAMVRLFSVPFMLRTLVSHWRKDFVSYRQGTISGIVQAWAWNMISRVIGFVLRTVVLSVWLVSELVLLITAPILLGIFIAWPFLALLGLIVGVALIIN